MEQSVVVRARSGDEEQQEALLQALDSHVLGFNASHTERGVRRARALAPAASKLAVTRLRS